MLDRTASIVTRTLRAARELEPLAASEGAPTRRAAANAAHGSGAGSGAVVLVPGFRNDADRLSLLARRLQSVGYRPYVLEQPERGMTSIAQSTQDLGHVLDAVRAETGTEALWLIGYSRGGLVARAHLQGSRDALAGSAGLVTIGTPHLGVTRAGLVSAVVGAHIPSEAIRARMGALSPESRDVRKDRDGLALIAEGAANTAWRALREQFSVSRATVEATEELIAGGRQIRRLAANLPSTLRAAHALDPSWRLVAVHGRLPAAASDGVVSVRSASLAGLEPRVVRSVEVTDAQAHHSRLADRPDVAQVVVDALGGHFN